MRSKGAFQPELNQRCRARCLVRVRERPTYSGERRGLERVGFKALHHGVPLTRAGPAAGRTRTGNPAVGCVSERFGAITGPKKKGPPRPATPGSPSRTRTYDHTINSRALYQLSYRGMKRGRRRSPPAAARKGSEESFEVNQGARAPSSFAPAAYDANTRAVRFTPCIASYSGQAGKTVRSQRPV